MKTIWKFPLDAADSQTIQMPEGAKILTVQVQDQAPSLWQDRTPFLWALIDDANPLEARKIFIATTGNSAEHVGNVKMNTPAAYIGTFQRAGLGGFVLVFHVFG